MKKRPIRNIAVWTVSVLMMALTLRCGSGDRQQINDNPNDLGMPDSATYSDSPMPGQPNGYAPSSSGKADSTTLQAIDSAASGSFQ